MGAVAKQRTVLKYQWVAPWVYNLSPLVIDQSLGQAIVYPWLPYFLSVKECNQVIWVRFSCIVVFHVWF